MNAALTLGSGLPVSIGEIDHELKKLWEQSGGVATRASLMNLAVYCEGRDAMADNTELIARITQAHACRALLICLDPGARQNKVQAWIGAHCHLSRAGAKQVCSEQITFLLEGASRGLIPSIVFSHLDSDLPLFLWWQGEFPNPIDAELWAWVDRLIFDSRAWQNQQTQFSLLRDSLVRAKCRMVLCDLNWTRTLYFRQALALTFDRPERLPLLRKIERIAMIHAPGHRCTALLVAGWLAAQLDWTNGELVDGAPQFWAPSGEPVRVELQERAGTPLREVTLFGGDASIRVSRDETSPFLHADVTLADGSPLCSLYPAGKRGRAGLIAEELMRGGNHRVYLSALEMAEKFLS